jgi:hypothetical protein
MNEQDTSSDTYPEEIEELVERSLMPLSILSKVGEESQNLNTSTALRMLNITPTTHLTTSSTIAIERDNSHKQCKNSPEVSFIMESIPEQEEVDENEEQHEGKKLHKVKNRVRRDIPEKKFQTHFKFK